MQYYFLTPRERKILSALLPIVLPDSPVQTPRLTRRMFYHIDRFLLHLPPILRMLFHLGALAFDFAPVLHLRSIRPFAASPEKVRARWVAYVQRRAFSPFQRWLHVARGLILLFYYSQEDVQAGFGYAPAAWSKDRVMQRRKKLNLTEEAPHVPEQRIST